MSGPHTVCGRCRSISRSSRQFFFYRGWVGMHCPSGPFYFPVASIFQFLLGSLSFSRVGTPLAFVSFHFSLRTTKSTTRALLQNSSVQLDPLLVFCSAAVFVSITTQHPLLFCFLCLLPSRVGTHTRTVRENSRTLRRSTVETSAGAEGSNTNLVILPTAPAAHMGAKPGGGEPCSCIPACCCCCRPGARPMHAPSGFRCRPTAIKAAGPRTAVDLRARPRDFQTQTPSGQASRWVLMDGDGEGRATDRGRRIMHASRHGPGPWPWP